MKALILGGWVLWPTVGIIEGQLVEARVLLNPRLPERARHETAGVLYRHEERLRRLYCECVLRN